MTFTISKDFGFEASHRLDGLPEGHQCARRHGHSYRVRVVVSGEGLDQVGFVMDYGAFAPFGAWISTHLDHRDLNDVLLGVFGDSGNPTAERLARHLYEVLGRVVCVPAGVSVVEVGVSETAKTWAWYRPNVGGVTA